MGNYDRTAGKTSPFSIKCHNHKFIECTLCKKLYDENTGQIKNCEYCGHKHCVGCIRKFGDKLAPKCQELIIRDEEKQMIDTLNDVLGNQYDFGMYKRKVIGLLTEYSSGVIVQCSNAKGQCQNEINFNFKAEILMNHVQNTKNPNDVTIYQYCPKYPTSGTIEICGKNRRIFCKDCTQNELVECRCCDLGKEPKPKNYDPFATGYSITASKCNNHKFVSCSICNWEYEEGDRVKVEWCAKCGSNHCSKCMKEEKECPFKDNN